MYDVSHKMVAMNERHFQIQLYNKSRVIVLTISFACTIISPYKTKTQAHKALSGHLN